MSADGENKMTPKEISRAASRIFGAKLPANLAIRDQQDQEDFGIDYEIEVMLPGDVPSGVIFKVQQKGTLELDLIDQGRTISHRDLGTAKARYYLREIRVPAAFVVVDVTNAEAYWVEVQGNPQFERAYREAVEQANATLTVHLPVENNLPDTMEAFLRAMGRSQDAVMVRYMTEATSPNVVQAAVGNLDFDETLNAARQHADFLRLERFERLKRAGDIGVARHECERILNSESETMEIRVAAGLNLIRFLGASALDRDRKTQARSDVSRQLVESTDNRDESDRLRIFAEFQNHTAEMNRLNDRLADVSDAGLGLIGELAQEQIVTELLEHFGQAQDRFAALLRAGQFQMVPQVWGMLANDTSMLIHLLRVIGMGNVASALATWFDQTLDTVTEIADRMEDWISLAFCALQQVVLADITNENEIDERAERAREIMNRLPESERTRHLDELERRVSVLRQPPLF